MDASDEIHEFASLIATAGATRDWRKIGARDVAEARGIILQLIFRERCGKLSVRVRMHA